MHPAATPLARWLRLAPARLAPCSTSSHVFSTSASASSSSAVPSLADWATVDPEGGGWQAYNLGAVMGKGAWGA
jgi:hypothetical protein